MFGQNLVEELGIIVIGESDMTHQTFLFLIHQPAEAVQVRVGLVVIEADIVQQIVIKILHAGLPSLLLEYLVTVFLRLDETSMQLRRQRITVSRITIHQRFLHNVLTLEAVIHPCGIKISEASLQESIHHLFHLLYIDVRRIVRIQQRQAHQTKAQSLL